MCSQRGLRSGNRGYERSEHPWVTNVKEASTPKCRSDLRSSAGAMFPLLSLSGGNAYSRLLIVDDFSVLVVRLRIIIKKFIGVKVGLGYTK